ncbi:unnamed protein product [Protopolystoma xenopodis]|uniref:Uncharacterized protein n=1 Tax=Protopolystoma xenopodis TaxID=117903 RepID=A0A3S4ZKV8_9PLAT|nr:unnamed protein product [Protopolystoma xenopodis]
MLYSGKPRSDSFKLLSLPRRRGSLSSLTSAPAANRLAYSIASSSIRRPGSAGRPVTTLDSGLGTSAGSSIRQTNTLGRHNMTGSGAGTSNRMGLTRQERIVSNDESKQSAHHHQQQQKRAHLHQSIPSGQFHKTDSDRPSEDRSRDKQAWDVEDDLSKEVCKVRYVSILDSHQSCLVLVHLPTALLT